MINQYERIICTIACSSTNYYTHHTSQQGQVLEMVNHQQSFQTQTSAHLQQPSGVMILVLGKTQQNNSGVWSSCHPTGANHKKLISSVFFMR